VFEETQHLLRRRVIGMPSSFHALCHVLSGALPRDVIRVARNLVSELERDPRLHSVTRALIVAELAEKCHGTSTAAKNSPEPRGREAVLEYVESLAELDGSAGALLAACADFPTTRAAALPRDDDEGRTLADLGYELNAFVYYCAGVAETFGPSASSGTLRQAAQRGDFEELARARQEFALHDSVAWRRLSGLRSRDGFATPLPNPREAAHTHALARSAEA
jgi:hypothetical protein